MWLLVPPQEPPPPESSCLITWTHNYPVVHEFSVQKRLCCFILKTDLRTSFAVPWGHIKNGWWELGWSWHPPGTNIQPPGLWHGEKVAFQKKLNPRNAATKRVCRRWEVSQSKFMKHKCCAGCFCFFCFFLFLNVLLLLLLLLLLLRLLRLFLFFVFFCVLLYLVHT